jgi:ornithine carbamoyltransferase
MRDFLDVDDLTPEELDEVLKAAADPQPAQVLSGKGAALVFEKPSARTRNSTEMAVVQLGGHPVSLRAEEVGIDVRETAEDVARTLACYHAVICARVYDHGHLERMAAAVDIPIVNLLSDKAHPCQAVADLLTLRDHFGHLEGLCVAYVGDWNNMAHSLALALRMTGATLRVGCPPGYGPPDGEFFDDPVEAVRGADAVYTDVWTSMGQEDEMAERRRAFAGWTVTPALLGDAVLLHCLPAHRGEEVDAAALEGPQSLVWPQAANRLPAARGVLSWLLS